MAVEKITELLSQQAESIQALNAKAEKQKDDQLKAQENLKADDEQNKLNQELAKIPLLLRDKIKEMREKIDSLFSKLDDVKTDPDSNEFDINALIGKLMPTVQALQSVTAPFAAVAGAVPVIGDLGPMLSKLASASEPSTNITKEEIHKKVEIKPELPPSFKQEIEKLQEDMQSLVQEILMILITTIFKMIDVVYSKLNIITSVIPLGNMFPLSLVPEAVKAGPTIKKFVTLAPSQVKKIVEGALKDKVAEAQALGIPEAPSVKAAIEAAEQKEEAAKTNSVPESTAAEENPPDTNVNSAPAIEDVPVLSNVSDVKSLAPTMPPDKTMQEIEDEWKSNFLEYELYLFKDNIEWENSHPITENYYSPRVLIKDNVWETIMKSAKLDGKNDPTQVKGLLSEWYRGISGKNAWKEFTLWSIANPFKYELIEKDGKYVEKMIKGMENEPDDLNLFSKGYLKDHRITADSDEFASWKEHMLDKIDKTKSDTLKDKIKTGLDKMPNYLDKVYIFKKDELPDSGNLVTWAIKKLF